MFLISKTILAKFMNTNINCLVSNYVLQMIIAELVNTFPVLARE